MKTSGFHASLRGGRKVFAVSIIIALILASFSAIGVFAAPVKRSQNQSGIGEDQLRELRQDIDWFNNLRTQPGRIANSADRNKLGQYLSQYALILRAAEGLLRNGGSNTSTQGNTSSSSGTSSNATSGQGGNTNNQGNGLFNSRYWNNLTTEQQMAEYLHMLRGLRMKIESLLGSNTNGNNSNGNTIASAGIPVTGGIGNQTSSSSSSNTTTQGNTSSSGTQSSGSTTTTQGSTSTSGSSSSTTANQSSTNTSANITNTSNAMQLFGGTELHDLRSAINWFIHFKSQPGKMNASDRAKMSQYLSRYAAILRAAEALVMRGSSNTTGQANTANGQSSTSSSSSSTSGQSVNSNNQATGFVGQFNSHWWNDLSLQQKLSVYLQMLRGLRDKIEAGGANGTTATVP